MLFFIENVCNEFCTIITEMTSYFDDNDVKSHHKQGQTQRNWLRNQKQKRQEWYTENET